MKIKQQFVSLVLFYSLVGLIFCQSVLAQATTPLQTDNEDSEAAKEKKVTTIVFDRPAHFPVYKYDRYGSSYAQRGVVILEGMTFKFDQDGNYVVEGQVEIPNRPVELRLQFLVSVPRIDPISKNPFFSAYEINPEPQRIEPIKGTFYHQLKITGKAAFLGASISELNHAITAAENYRDELKGKAYQDQVEMLKAKAAQLALDEKLSEKSPKQQFDRNKQLHRQDLLKDSLEKAQQNLEIAKGGAFKYLQSFRKRIELSRTGTVRIGYGNDAFGF
ncbi:MAG: hypothetical protein AAF623_00715 [Planctomycetota bacterium]